MVSFVVIFFIDKLLKAGLGSNHLDSLHENVGNDWDTQEQEAQENEVDKTQETTWKQGCSRNEHHGAKEQL